MSILTYVLHKDGEFNKNSLGGVSEAAKLAGQIGGEAGAVVVGDGDDLTDDLLKSLGKYGATKVWRAKAPEGLGAPVVDVMAKLVQDNGYDTVEVELPAVISVGDAINEPRYPSLKAIMGAKKKQLDTKSTGDVGIDDVGLEAERVGEAGSKVICGDFKAPPKKAAGEIIEDEDTDETVQKIVSWLEERKLI